MAHHLSDIHIHSLVRCSLYGTKFDNLVQHHFFSQYAGGGVTVVGARHHVWWVVAPALLRVGWGLVPAPEKKKKAHRHSSAGATGTLCALPTGASWCQRPASISHLQLSSSILFHPRLVNILIRVATLPTYHCTSVDAQCRHSL